MILLINICKEKLHYYEFVKSIEDILKKNNIEYFVKHYKDIKKRDLKKSEKVVICGTSLKDNKFIKDIGCFKWIMNFKKPILGICGGMQIIGLLYGGRVKKKTEIGFYKENFKKNFFGLLGEKEVYHLHNYYVDFNKLNEFESFTDSKITQAVKLKGKKIYGVLFHPEVRQKDLIINFLKL